MQPLKQHIFNNLGPIKKGLKHLNTFLDSVREATKKGTIEAVIIPDQGGGGGDDHSPYIFFDNAPNPAVHSKL